MISHRHKCMFFQVPKCATTTIVNWFLRGIRFVSPPL